MTPDNKDNTDFPGTDTVTKAVAKLEEGKALSFEKALQRPLTLKHHSPGNFLMFTVSGDRAVHYGTFTAHSLSQMDIVAERLQLVWNAAAGKSNQVLQQMIEANDNQAPEKTSEAETEK